MLYARNQFPKSWLVHCRMISWSGRTRCGSILQDMGQLIYRGQPCFYDPPAEDLNHQSLEAFCDVLLMQRSDFPVKTEEFSTYVMIQKAVSQNNEKIDYVLEGSKGTPFAGGCYYGKIKFPPEYPYKPPSISMITPNGRFAPHKKICLSMSDFHPETWNPMWSVSSILTGLLSFMMDDGQTTGSIKTSDEEKRQFAHLSLAYNCESKNCPNFKKLFPEYVEKYNQSHDEQLTSKHQMQKDHPSPPAIIERRAPRIDGEGNHAPDIAAPRRQAKKVPVWLLLLLVSVFGFVMALPLLQP